MSAANRLRRFISRQGLAVAGVLLVLGVAAVAGAGWVYTNPPVETVVDQTQQQSVSTGVQTSAIVTGNTSLYDSGERLQNMPVYFLRASPNMTVTVQTSTPENVETQVSQRLEIRQQATRNGESFFEANRTLIDSAERVTSDSATASTELNMTAIRQESSQIQNEIGSVGSYQIAVALTVDYQTDQYEGTLSASTPIVFTGGAYWLSDPLSANRQHSQTVTRQVTSRPDPAVYGGLAILGLVGIAGAYGLIRFRGQIDVDALELEFYHEEYDEWISEGEFPTGTDKRYISINTLEDLVDIAIDSNKRVIFDPSLDVYSVVDGDLVYYFSSDPFNIDVWLDT